MPDARSAPPPDFQSVLVYTYEDTVGDGLAKLPFLRALRGRFPAARVTWCAGVGPSAYAGPLAPLVPGLMDEVMERAGIGRGPGDLLLVQPLGGRRFDLVLDTQTAILRTLCARRIRHRLFLTQAAGFRLSDRRPESGRPWPRHLVTALSALLDLAALAAAAGEPPLAIPEPYVALAARLLPDGPVHVGIAPGAGDRAKCWPLANFVALARDQAARGRVPVFFLGPGEEEWRREIADKVPTALFPESEEAVARAGLGGPVLAVALASRLAAAVANDSGAGHMLAAGGAPLVSLFSKHDPVKYAPAAPRLAVLDSKDYGGTDPALIPQQAVAGALERLLPPEPA
ncbi:MAG TPA: glycosyltransferase family 9 protein [Alphaproteobacteria bacterium]